MLNNPLLWYAVALFAPTTIPWEQRDWRYFEECQVIRDQEEWFDGNQYCLVESFYPDSADLPLVLYAHPPTGWVIARAELVWFIPDDASDITKTEFFQFGKIGPREWRACIYHYWGEMTTNHSFYIRIWMLRTKEAKDTGKAGVLCCCNSRSAPTVGL